MASREALHSILVTVLGTSNVYFQPPESVKLSYPCIVYNKTYVMTKHADNKIYNMMDRYKVTVIDRDPDSTIYKDLMNTLELCRHETTMVADNLNNFVLDVYF